eukprot:TRINITY_DN781961_c0_g1_i1.p1 TRINITY_DN781961_c0_g1~~TRINITY_DN781961_c0_g1_i1.p1  ORF type:complete len:250 (-),score=56.12 TRINITY_DN781961_c0_g1_i1:69-776(-)
MLSTSRLNELKVEIDDILRKHTISNANILSNLGLKPENLSKQTRDYSKLFGEIGSCVDSPDSSCASLVLAINEFRRLSSNFTNKDEHLDGIIANAKYELAETESYKSSLEGKLEEYSNLSDQALEDEIRALELEISDLKKEKVKQSDRIITLEVELKHACNGEEVTHGGLLRMQEELEKHEFKCQELKKDIGNYIDLPPNIETAKKLIIQRRKELKEIEEKIEKHMGGIEQLMYA